MCWIACSTPNSVSPAGFRIMDERIQMELVLESPEIMTPIGLTIDTKDALYVLESHTHTPQQSYQGPQFDRVKKGADENGDGIPDSWTIFADSLNDGMNVVLGEANSIIVVEKNRVLTLWDRDQDGVSEERTTLLVMDPPDNVYDHAGLLGAAISEDGWLYISRGNTGGQRWTITGTDGRQISGYGDGGNVLRCRLDGSEVEEIATGFWNPFDIGFTQEGRLLVTDNDPDSRGPNRLVELVPGGNYGYQSLYGGSGIHPFLAWNGELPGTLPYAAALGEAPCGFLDAGLSNFPVDYGGNVLVAIWEENAIVRIPLQARGSSVEGESELLIKGDSSFHPVAMATNSKGDIYLTDWVVRQYPNHGKGKIWRIKAKREQGRENREERRGGEDFFAYQPLDYADLVEMLEKGDVFHQAVARKQLGGEKYQEEIAGLLGEDVAELRLQALLIYSAAKRSIPAPQLRQLLQDPVEDIRRMSLIYLAQNGRRNFLPSLERALADGHITPSLIDTYLATIRHLQPAFVQGYQSQTEESSKKLPRKLPEGYLMGLITNPRLDPALRAIILPYLENPAEELDRLLPILEGATPELQEALLLALRQVSKEEIATSMLEIAKDVSKPKSLRAQAISSLRYQSPRFCEEIQEIATEGSKALAGVAEMYLSFCGSEFASQVPERPTSDALWTEAVDGTGDAQQGKWVFQSPQAQCLTCHKVEGWGGAFGPDLSHIGSSKSKELLISSILAPSEQISPEWQGWFVKDQEGKTHLGRQIDVGFRNVELMLQNGEFVTFQSPQSYGMAQTSLMPEGLENQLTTSQFNDLIAYLQSLQ